MLPLCTACVSIEVCAVEQFFSHLNQLLRLALMAKRFSYAVAFKLSVIEFAEKTGK